MVDLTVRHRLTDVDHETRTAVCVVCGPTDIRLKGGTKRECMGKRRAADALRGITMYSVTPEAYAALLAAQGGVCAICKEPPGDMRLSIDHDHACCPGDTTCGQCVRGLLCSPCNLGLGNFRDDKDRLRQAVAYLSR